MVAMKSAQDRADYPRYLLRLCELERIDRERRNVERRIRLARFPQTKSFDTFDFAAQPSLTKALVLVLIARPPPPNAPASQKRLRRDANRKIRAFGGSKSETVISVTPRVHVYTFNF